MFMFNAHRRIGVVASLATSVLILGGCRSTSVQPSPSINSGATSSGKAPFYRSYDSDNYESPANQPAAPFPGYSDQIAPLPPLETPATELGPNDEIPPAPSAQRSRWNRLNGGMKLSSTARNNRDVSQTAAKSDRRNSSQNKVQTTVTPRKERVVTEEVVQPRSTANTYESEAETSGPFHSPFNDDRIEPPKLLPPDR